MVQFGHHLVHADQQWVCKSFDLHGAAFDWVWYGPHCGFAWGWVVVSCNHAWHVGHTEVTLSWCLINEGTKHCRSAWFHTDIGPPECSSCPVCGPLNLILSDIDLSMQFIHMTFHYMQIHLISTTLSGCLTYQHDAYKHIYKQVSTCKKYIYIFCFRSH